MPLIVDLSDTDITTAVSDDGILTGTTDPDHAGVRFIVNYRQADNVVNGDFEASAAGWGVGGASPPTLEWLNSGSLSGIGSLLAHWGTGSGTVVGSLVGLTIGQDYRITAWAYKGGHVGDDGPAITLHVGATVGYSGGNHNRWSQIGITFTATATSQTLNIVSDVPSGPGQSTKIDNVQCFPLHLPPVHHMRLWRRNPDGTVTRVRGSDPTPAPDGVAPGYDVEAPLGSVCSWWATLHDLADDVLVTSSEIMLPVAAPTNPDTWVKSVGEPGFSTRVVVETWPDFAYSTRTMLGAVLDSPWPVANVGVQAAATGTLTVLTLDADTRAALADLFHVGSSVTARTPGPFLLQTNPVNGMDDLYFVVTGDILLQKVMRLSADQIWRWTIPLAQVARPPTAQSNLRDPDRAFETLPYATWDAVGLVYSHFLHIGD